MINFEIYLPSTSKAIAEEKKGKVEIQKIGISQNKKNFLDEKEFFIVFEGLSFGEK